jgi:hypothetical protein
MQSEQSRPSGVEGVCNHEPTWSVRVASRLVRRDLVDLATDRCSAVHVREFFSPALARLAVHEANELAMTRYSLHLIRPRVFTSGITLFDYCDDRNIREDYWEAAKKATADRKMAFSESGDLFWLSMAYLREVWRAPVELAMVQGRELFAGAKREFSTGTKFYFNEISRELPNVFDCEIVHQFDFNLFLEMPHQGGSLTIAQHLYHPRDERHRDDYGYSDEVVATDQKVTIKPEVGDAVIFYTKNMHSIEAVIGEGRHIILSFFIGLTADGRLVLWS